MSIITENNNDILTITKYIEQPGVTDVVIPGIIGNIAPCAFKDCANIKSVTFLDELSMLEIDSEAFSGCTSLETIVFNCTVTAFGKEIFKGCTNLKNIVCKSSFNWIDKTDLQDTAWYRDYPDDFVVFDNMLLAYKGKDKDITVPENIEIIAGGAFEDCDFIKSVTLPNGVSKIGENAFGNCSKLESVSLPDTLTAIESFAFCICTALTSITIPESVRFIGGFVFAGCENLEQINVLSKEAVPMLDSVKDTKWCKDQKGDYVILGSWLIQYRADGEHITIPEGVTQICPGVFEENSIIKNADIPVGVKLIGFEAFRHCSSLERIILPGTEVIGDGAFIGCSALKEVTVCEGTRQICYGAFKNCTSLKKLTLPASVTDIYPGAFDGCDNLSELIMPDEVRTMLEKSLSKSIAFKITVGQVTDSGNNN